MMLAMAVCAGCGSDHEGRSGHSAGEHGAMYACPMLCVPPSPAPGDCPVCGMELKPIEGGAEGNAPRIAMSERSRKLARVQEAEVERKSVSAEIRMVGKIVFDESRLANVTARVGGRIDRLYADFTGMRVEEGDHLVYLYSPDLLSAQEELVQGLRLGNSSLINAAREKLRLLGITPEQVAAIEKRGSANDHMTIYSPISGIVVGKNVVEGSYVKTGSPMYTIADLSHLWVKLDAYESDIALIRYGQEVAVTAESHPGRVFKGTVAFIDPVLDEKTRTVGIRVNVANTDGALKPGMFVRATVSAQINALGNPIGMDLSGKWICPMHPEDMHDDSGTCTICEMPLKKAEDTDYASGPSPRTKPLVIPATAPLITGKRAVVYIATANEGEYEGREVTLGRKAGDYYVVLDGLNEGDRVVVNGNFRIDSALQIMGRPSMMNASPAGNMQGTPQAKCPVMGGNINRDVYVDHEGYRIYFCCPGCDGKFRKDPDVYIQQMKKDGIDLEPVKTEPSNEQ